MPGQPHLALASMGIYVFNSDVLVRALEADAADPDSQRTSAGTSSRRSFPADGCARMPSTTRTRRPRNAWRDIGALDA